MLVSAIRYEELEMPPDAPLSDQEQKDIVKWIQQGAYWPISDESSDREQADTAGAWWAAEPIDPGHVPMPAPGSHSRTVIDRYVDKRLSEQGLHRAPVADRQRLIRRLSYDLLGLPPSPQDIADGYALTGFFLLRHVLEPRGLDLAEARASFIAAVLREPGPTAAVG